MKKATQFLFAISGFFLFSSSLNAQMAGSNAYLKGNNVEIGISGLGGFEGAPYDSLLMPAGLHYRSNNPYFGFVANPQLNAWTTFDGDFFTPGSPENGWGFEIADTGGVSQGNNCSYLQQINGAITSWNYSAPQILCDWEGDANSGTDIHFKINYELQDNDLFYITTIFVTNNTTSPITDFYYYRNLDPDNNIMLTSDYTTQNTIISQITTGGPNTRVSGSQTLPWNSYFEFLAVDSNWVAGYGGFANRDASNMYNGVAFTQTVGATNFADEAIYLAYKIPVLAPGGTQSFKFCNVFDPTSVVDAIAALNASSTSVNDIESIQNPVSVYPNPFNGNTTITIDRSIQLKNAELQVYDVVGKLISVSKIESHEFNFENTSMSEAIYIYKLINNAEQIATGKLIIK